MDQVRTSGNELKSWRIHVDQVRIWGNELRTGRIHVEIVGSFVSSADTQSFENLGLEGRLCAEAKAAVRLLASTARNKRSLT